MNVQRFTHFAADWYLIMLFVTDNEEAISSPFLIFNFLVSWIFKFIAIFKRTKIRTNSYLNNVLKYIITKKPSDYSVASQVILPTGKTVYDPELVLLFLWRLNFSLWFQQIGIMFSYIHLWGLLNESISKRWISSLFDALIKSGNEFQLMSFLRGKQQASRDSFRMLFFNREAIEREPNLPIWTYTITNSYALKCGQSSI